jgi:pimeloyl-ACP methyl ester carboxylesterase
MINRRLAVLAALLAPLAACVSGSDSTTPSPNPNSGFQVRFTPLGGLMPFPNDLFFNGSTTGTLNIPGDPAVTQNAPLLALNHLDGFGTQSDISIYFTAPVDKNSLAANVAPTPLAAGTDYSIGLSPGIDSGNEIVTIKPLKPLAASSVNGATPTPATYLVVVTTGVKDTSGNPVSPSADYQAILSAFLPVLSGKAPGTTGNPALDKVGLFTAAQLAVAAGAGLDPTKIAVTFSFSTQYLGLSLAELAAHAAATAQPPGVGIIDTGLTVCAALVAAKKLPSSAACATAAPGSTITEVFAGDVALPYYLPVPTKNDPTAALTGFWHNANGGDTALSASATSVLPKATVAQNVIPILVALPKAGGPCTMPVSGWPVVIFQHGITRNREDMLAIASTLAVGAAPTLCNAVLAIDLPLHGVTDTTDALYLKGHERTFDMDLEDNNTLAAGPDNKIDASGAWFINLQSTITSRDNLREGAADLLNLVATLPALDAITLPATINLFDSSQVSFVGHSLGGIVGTEFLGADTAGAGLTSTAPKIATATLAMPGGHIAELLRNSPAFGPIIDAGLAANGLVKGTQSYYDFYSEAQAAVEDGDPANYAVLAAAGHPIHMLEVVGGFAGAGDSCDLPDLVVPNANTDLLASLMGLAQVNTTTPGSKFIVRFLVGDHGSILDPSVPGAPTTCANDPTNQLRYGAATVEMQTEAVKWVVAAGTAVSINNVPPIIK